MRSLALLCLLAFATSAHAAGPEQNYLDLRDRYIAKFSKAKENDETFKQHDAALSELARVLRGLVGPVTIKGLPADGKSNVDTLFKGDSGFGHLDGLGFASEGDKMQAVVTTTGLLKHWLGEHREDGMPQEIGAAIKSDRFYYQAIQDAAFAKYAELPVTKPASASAAVAVLGVRGNGDLKGPPHEIDVVAVQGEKVFFLSATDAVKTAEIPACEKVWTQMMARKTPQDAMAKEDQAMDAYTKCFAKEAPGQSWFGAAVKKAQSQLDLLPLR
ncbi:putative CoA-binding protein [Bradyrhizobium sp. USDA 377]